MISCYDSVFGAAGVMSVGEMEAGGSGAEDKLKIPVIDLPNQEKNQY